jgi:ComF family protein
MKLIDWLFPPRCLACHRFLSERAGFCRHCRWPHAEPSCQHFGGDRSCRKVFAAGRYEGVLLEMILRLKYRNEESLAHYLGQKMAEEVAGEVEERGIYDLILPVPLHCSRLRKRGFNQALLLAREVGKRLQVPVDPFLFVKTRKTRPQAALKGEERQKNLKNVFLVKHPEKIREKKILLIDDVYTTGATVEEAASVLLKAGAGKVEALVLART